MNNKIELISEDEMKFIESCINDKPFCIYKSLEETKEDIEWYQGNIKNLIAETRRLKDITSKLERDIHDWKHLSIVSNMTIGELRTGIIELYSKALG